VRDLARELPGDARKILRSAYQAPAITSPEPSSPTLSVIPNARAARVRNLLLLAETRELRRD